MVSTDRARATAQPCLATRKCCDAAFHTLFRQVQLLGEPLRAKRGCQVQKAFKIAEWAQPPPPLCTT